MVGCDIIFYMDKRLRKRINHIVLETLFFVGFGLLVTPAFFPSVGSLATYFYIGAALVIAFSSYELIPKKKKGIGKSASPSPVLSNVLDEPNTENPGMVDLEALSLKFHDREGSSKSQTGLGV